MDSKMVNMSSLPFAKEPVISFLIISLVTPLIQANEDNPQYVTKIAPMLLGCIISLYVQLWSHFKRLTKHSPDSTSSNNNCICMEAAGFVATSYVSLLLANWSYIWIAIFPVIAIGFILALFYELNHQRSRQPDDGEGNASSGGGQGGQKEIKLAEVHKAAALVPYWLLCVMRQFHTAENLAVSQFLLFFSSMLGALTLMLKQLALTAGAPPGVAPASVLLRKASLVVLLVTVHAFAAELLGENVMLFILPEIVPVILWSSLSLNRRNSWYITADKIRAQITVITFLGAAVAGAVFAFLYFSMDELLLSWCTKAMLSCGVSGLLVYYVVFILCQWPELDSTASSFVEEALNLLKLWANVLLNGAAALLAFALLGVVRLGLHKQMLDQPAKIFSHYVARYLNS